MLPSDSVKFIPHGSVGESKNKSDFLFPRPLIFLTAHLCLPAPQNPSNYLRRNPLWYRLSGPSALCDQWKGQAGHISGKKKKSDCFWHMSNSAIPSRGRGRAVCRMQNEQTWCWWPDAQFWVHWDASVNDTPSSDILWGKKRKWHEKWILFVAQSHLNVLQHENPKENKQAHLTFVWWGWW